MPFHDVQQGETLIGLADKNGLKDWTSIADHADNASLKDSRPDPGILKPGDRVFIPNREMLQHPSAVDASHKFKLTRPKAWMRVAVKDADGNAYADKDYVLSVGSKTFTGKTTADGVIEQPVPVDATFAKLVVTVSATQKEEWDLRIGAMDPLDSISGVQARLNNLGFDCGDPDGVEDEQTTAAVKAFQERIGVEATGTIDDTLRGKLKTYYDPAESEASQDVKPTEET